jgi:hypothetical protein
LTLQEKCLLSFSIYKLYEFNRIFWLFYSKRSIYISFVRPTGFCSASPGWRKTFAEPKCSRSHQRTSFVGHDYKLDSNKKSVCVRVGCWQNLPTFFSFVILWLFWREMTSKIKVEKIVHHHPVSKIDQFVSWNWRQCLTITNFSFWF